MFNNIPSELKGTPNWVCWKSIPDEKSHSGIKKIPINPQTGGHAMSNNPLTWSDFATAVRESVKYQGIGYMFTDSPFFGVDIDDCREAIDDYNNGGTNNIVYECIHGLQSYSELSQSGNGIHIICKGELPKGARRKGKVEMYDHGRFFIMTGNSCSEYANITECTEAIKPLYQKYLGETKKPVCKEAKSTIPSTLTEEQIIQKAMHSRNGAKFTALFKGDISGYLSQSEADLAFCNILAFWCRGDFSLMDSIFRKSALMRDKWDEKRGDRTYGHLCLSKAIDNCPEHYSAKSKSFASADKNQDMKIFSLDDTGNAQRMLAVSNNNLRYCYIDKCWLHYENGKWCNDIMGIVQNYADLVLERMKKELKIAVDVFTVDELSQFRKHIKRTRSNSAKKAMISEFEHLVAICPSDMDKDKTLVNLQNGVLNLEDCTITPHSKDFYMTRMLGTSFPQEPKHPEKWLRFLKEIFDSDEELIRYVQKALGYSLSGLTSEQCVFFLYGTGRNGKSTFLEIVRTILGGYATNIQPESIMMKAPSSSANSDIARLKGARFVTTVEPNNGMRLNDGLLKQLSGDDVVTARKLYGNEFEFYPEFKIWMATNYMPKTDNNVEGLWRRIHVIPFNVTISKENVDKNLKSKLKAELPDILAWMAEGYRLWKIEGLEKPTAVLNATKKYRNEMDSISDFLNSECIVTSGEIQASILYDIYHSWANEHDKDIMSKRKFGSEISKRFLKKKSKGLFWYLGISLPEYPQK